MIQEGKHIHGTGGTQSKKEMTTYDIEKRIAARGDGSNQLSAQRTVILFFEALGAA